MRAAVTLLLGLCSTTAWALNPTVRSAAYTPVATHVQPSQPSRCSRPLLLHADASEESSADACSR